MNAQLRGSLYDIWDMGGLERASHGTRGVKRELQLNLEMSGLDPEQHEIIHYRAVNRWDGDDVFDEWAKPVRPLSHEAEKVVGITNELLAHCRASGDVMEDFRAFIDGAALTAQNLTFDLGFLCDR